MAQEADVPRGLWGKIEKLVDRKIAEFARSGFLRNAAITGGAGLSIRDGGSLNVDGGGGVTVSGGGGVSIRDNGQIALYAADGTVQFWLGPTGPALPDGTPQQGWMVRRADGTLVLDLMDIDVSDGVLRQALNWRDRSGNVVLADDTDSGQGVARPYVPGSFYRADYADWVTATGGTFVTKFRARMPKQQPKLHVRAWASNDTSGATGQLRVLVNGAAWGPVQTTSFSISEYEWGPLPVDGDHMSTLTVELQARVASGAGGVRLEPSRLEGRQT